MWKQKTASGIIIPESAQEKPLRGNVIAVGSGASDNNGNRIAMDAKVGDIVLYSKFAGNNIKLDDNQEVLIMKESEVLAIVK
ncbi:MAG TPA: co-chaperone GroES [Candidatus Megaira endosymbiont of Hartmannula sinica]|nr:co-chaperone GroES [Candidatus Megaera endosymbiont of Hartmannula sinica]